VTICCQSEEAIAEIRRQAGQFVKAAHEWSKKSVWQKTLDHEVYSTGSARYLAKSCKTTKPCTHHYTERRSKMQEHLPIRFWSSSAENFTRKKKNNKSQEFDLSWINRIMKLNSEALFVLVQRSGRAQLAYFFGMSISVRVSPLRVYHTRRTFSGCCLPCSA